MKKVNEVNNSLIKEELEHEKMEQKQRGARIKEIREKELKLKKAQLGRKIGISGQFLGLVEDGKGNLVYKSIKKLKDLSGHSADYILYGLDDSIIESTQKCLERYSEQEIIQAIDVIKEIALFIRKIDKDNKNDIKEKSINEENIQINRKEVS